MRRPRVLLTGFGPFPGAPHNPTGEIVARVAGLAPRFDVEVVGHLFPTTWAALERLPSLVGETEPDAVLHLGLARRARAVRVERMARNLAAVTAVDADGVAPAGRVLTPGASPRRLVRAPVRQMADRLRTAGLPVEISEDAGAYLCNGLLWRSLETHDLPVAFLHLPPIGRPLAGGRVLRSPEVARGIAACLPVLVGEAWNGRGRTAVAFSDQSSHGDRRNSRETS